MTTTQPRSKKLMLRYQNRLLTILAHLVRDREAAEDLAQDVFLRVYRARKRYVPGAKFSTWLFTIANNVARNALRSRSRRKEVHVAADGSGGDGVESAGTVGQSGQRSNADPAARQDRNGRDRPAWRWIR